MDKPTYLLIHGAWAGPWIWEETASALTRAGRSVEVADPLGQQDPEGAPLDETFETVMARLVAMAMQLPGELIVVGHSGGGVLASTLAETLPGKVTTLAYFAGFMLPSGLNYSQIASQQPAGTGIGDHLDWDAAGAASQVPLQAAKDVFFQDCPQDSAEAAASKLSPFPDAVRSAAPILSEERFGRAARVYIECRADRSIPLAAQREMQRLVPGARRFTLCCGHAPMLAAFDELLDVLLQLAKA